MNDFKYPSLKTFFDCDSVACVFTDEVVKSYPKIDELSIDYRLADGSYTHSRPFNSFSWELSGEVVMASSDLSQFVSVYNKILVRCYEEKITIEDVEFADIGVCNVCDELLFPDDELYSDEDTHVSLCDSHSAMNEMSGNYFKLDDNRLFVEGTQLHNLDNLPLTLANTNSTLVVFYKGYEVGEVSKDWTRDGIAYIHINGNVVNVDSLSLE
jgi:hypothetical protein